MVRSPLFDVEAQYRRLGDVLEGPVSDRWAIVQTARFLASLSPAQPKIEAYLLPLAEPLLDRTQALNPIGLRPRSLLRPAEILRTAQQKHSGVRDLPAVRRAESALRRRAGLLFGYAGAIGRALTCMLVSDIQERFGDLDGDAPRARLAEAQDAVEGTESVRALRWLEGHWDRQDEADADRGAWVPVVERLPSWARSTDGSGTTAPERVGALRRLAVQLYGPAETADQLRMDGTVHGAEEHDPTEAPVAAARQLLTERSLDHRGHSLQGRVVFDASPHEIEGRSAGLAIAALFYGAVLEHTRRRRRLHVRPEVALTGGVDADGTVRPVSDDGLSVKVRTAFFSPKACLVVPEAQQDAAESTRDRLLEEFPHGRLEVVGVDELDALFYDRRLTRLDRIGWARHTAQRLWDRRGRVVAGTLIAALLLVIGVLLYGPFDKNPVAVTFGGSQMQLRNHAGRVVDRVSVGSKLVDRAHKQDDSYKAYDLYDLTDDGQNEVCWAQKNYMDPEVSMFVACRTVGADAPLWRTPLTVDLSFPEKPAVKPNPFLPVRLLAGDLDDNGRPEVYLTAKHQPYFPGLVVQYDAVTGEQKQRYIHAGHLNAQPIALDLDRDGGVKELLVGGTSNAYSQGVLVVLDPRTMDGHGPVTSEYRLADTPPAAERAYVRFPYSPVGRARQVAHPVVRRLEHQPASGRIRAEVLDGRYARRQDDRLPYVLVHFEYTLRPVSVGTSTPYDQLADSFVAKGLLDAVPDGDDFERYRDRIRYWTGTGWSSEPTASDRWRSAMGEE